MVWWQCRCSTRALGPLKLSSSSSQAMTRGGFGLPLMDATSTMVSAYFDVQRAQLFPRNGADVTPTKSSASRPSGSITKPVAESTAVTLERVFPATPASSAPSTSSTAMATPVSLTATKEADAGMGKEAHKGVVVKLLQPWSPPIQAKDKVEVGALLLSGCHYSSIEMKLDINKVNRHMVMNKEREELLILSVPLLLNTRQASRMFKKDEVGFAPEQLPPPGVKRPIYGQRYWMCRNYSYSPEKPKHVPKGRKGKAKIPVKEPEVPPPICNFVEWIDKEMSEFDKRLIKSWRGRQEEREERQRQRAAKEKAERERREELELRDLARLNREKEERAEDRSRKLARAQRAKDAESEAARKGKYPRCTQ
uniref:Uncharacterized protein n=2 Tax=Oryza punctata TaxID=4537 RepID=A0A0E0L1G2_ORYPU